MADEAQSGGEGNVDTSNMSAEEINELQKQNCIFCKIAKKEIPAKILHEDDKVLCILDINPASEGHILIYPKEHYMILPHIPDETLKHLFRTVKLMSNTLLKTLQCKGTSIFIANGMAAGQKAPHVLIHVFPRRENDGLLELPKYEMTEDQLDNLKKTMSPYINQIFGKSARGVKAITKESKEEKKPAEIKSSRDIPNIPKREKSDTPKDHKKQGSKDAKDDKNVDLDDIAKLFGG